MRGKLVEKLRFAREAGFYNPFFASGLPRQKTLLSAQLVRTRRLRLTPRDTSLRSAYAIVRAVCLLSVDKRRKAWLAMPGDSFLSEKS